MANNPLKKVFQNVHVYDFKEYNRKPITINNDSIVDKAVKLMADNKVTSLPVVDEKGGNKCIGIVDVLDLVTSVLSVAPDPLTLEEKDLKTLEIAGHAMGLEPIGAILNASGHNPYVPIMEDESCLNIINLFARGLHRVPIIDREQRVVGTLSQTDVVRRLYNEMNAGNLKNTAEKSIQDLKLFTPGAKSPTRVKDESSVLYTLQTLHKEHLSAVPVINEFGILVGNFSASDLRGIYTDYWPSFKLRVDEYLSKYSPGSLKPIVVYPDTKFRDVVRELVESKVHRVWVVDGLMRPQGVVSTTDIMKLVIDTTYQA